VGSTVRLEPIEVPTRAVVECKITGCGWVAEIPTLYRIVLDPTSQHDGGRALVSTRVEVDDASVAAFDAYLAGHLEQHALVETVLEHVDDPGPSEPAP
jgi:hypothetical protein